MSFLRSSSRVIYLKRWTFWRTVFNLILKKRNKNRLFQSLILLICTLFCIITDAKLEKQTNNKRRDIQGLRGVAIIYVVAFHLFPKRFPFGFLGVDIFFVISGYLITMILLREQPFSLKHFIIFYKKRIKRIFPAYHLMLLLFLFCGWQLLTPTDYSTLRKDAIWAASFATNIHKYLKNLDYFAEVVFLPVKNFVFTKLLFCNICLVKSINKILFR